MTTNVLVGEQFTPFLPSTFTVPEEEDRLRTFLTDNLSKISDVVNDKKIGIYTQITEVINGESWAYLTTAKTRAGYQSISYIPSFPNSSTLTLTLPNIPQSATSIPQFPIQDINQQFVVTQVHGTANKPCTNPDATTNGTGDYFSFMAQGDSRISFTMSNKRIVITTTTDLSAYSGFIIVNYIRDGA